MLSAGANINAADASGRTALICVVKGIVEDERAERVKLLADCLASAAVMGAENIVEMARRHRQWMSDSFPAEGISSGIVDCPKEIGFGAVNAPKPTVYLLYALRVVVF